MNVLHVAPINVAGVPFSMMDLHRKFGHHARLITLHDNRFGFPEDICLHIPLPHSPFATMWRDYKRAAQKLAVRIGGYNSDTFLPTYRANNVFEHIYFRLSDMRRQRTIYRAIEEFGLEHCEIIHYDGGVDLFRDARLAKRWKKEGKKIVCHYMGSDLRLRGVHPVLDELSDLNLTNESDHLLRHPDIHYIYIPFDASGLTPREVENQRLRILHSPTNRAMKGTHRILPVIERLRKERPIDFVLVENLPHHRVIEIKRTCDIAIEQVGNYGGTGYGRNSLENLALGIPTVTEMTPDYVAWLPENPFILATEQTLFEKLIELIDDETLRRSKAIEGRRWVEKYHSYESVYKRLMELYREHGIIGQTSY
jgi:glycosyltransferase involved in cell wall biosynthesis